MKASEARILTEKAYTFEGNGFMKNLYTDIEKAASVGRTWIAVKSPDTFIIQHVMTQLNRDGYKVKRNSGHDQLDGMSWDNLEISWE